jgi:hypothetical protein
VCVAWRQVVQHGYAAMSVDLRLVKNRLASMFPHLLILVAEGLDHEDVDKMGIEAMGQSLASEVGVLGGRGLLL